MTLYETIFTRRQVRNYPNSPVPKDRLDHILAFVSEADGKTAISAIPKSNDGKFHIEITYKEKTK